MDKVNERHEEETKLLHRPFSCVVCGTNDESLCMCYVCKKLVCKEHRVVRFGKVACDICLAND